MNAAGRHVGPDGVLSVVTTVPADIPALGEQLANEPTGGAQILDRRAMSAGKLIRRVLEADGNVDALILNGSQRVDQFAAALLWRRRSRTAVVISDCTWKVGSSLLDRLANRAGLRAIDSQRVTYCVLSAAERESFPRTWSVDHRRVVFTPFCYTLTGADFAHDVATDGSVFAGGDSMRDYGPLVDAATRIGVRIVIAATNVPSPAGGRLPANLEAGPVPHAAYQQLMRRAAVVVVPLQAGAERSAGQQSYLNAMALRKIVVVTDSPGVRDYVEDGETGIVVPPGNADALGTAVGWALEPANGQEVDRMRTRAHEAACNRFTPLKHYQALLEVAGVASAHARARSETG